MEDRGTRLGVYIQWLGKQAIPILLARLSRSILVAGLPQTEQSRGGPNCEKYYCRAARCRCTLLANSHSLSWPHNASSCLPLSSSRRKLGTPQRPDAYIARRLFSSSASHPGCPQLLLCIAPVEPSPLHHSLKARIIIEVNPFGECAFQKSTD